MNSLSLILTPNNVTLTSTILAHFLVMLVHCVSSRRRIMAKLVNICLFRSILELNRMPRNINESFFTDLLGYMVIQIIYKQLF
jgi:hypothetical protein